MKSADDIHTRCLACASSTRFVTRRRSRDYDDATVYAIYQCDDCGSFTADCAYRPELYDEDYYLIAEDPRAQDPQMTHYARVVDRLMHTNGRGPKVLDVGCGSGRFLNAYAIRNPTAEINGLEINPGAVEKIKKDFPEFTIHSGHEELGDATFDGVCSWNVIEHVPDPRAFVSQLARSVEVGGVVAISTPNHVQINRWRRGMDKWEAIDPPHHLCILSRHALRQIFAEYHLAVIHVSTFSWHYGGFFSRPRWWDVKYVVPIVLGKLQLGGNLLMIGRRV